VSPPVLAADQREEKVYIFSALGVWTVDTKTILSNVRDIGLLSGFDPTVTKGLDLVLHAESGVFVGLKRMDRVFIIPERASDSQVTYNFTTVTEFNGSRLFPQDVALIGNILFVLDFYKGVFIYELVQHTQALPRHSIVMNSFGGNYRFRVYLSTIFVNFNDIDGSKVAEIKLDLSAGTSELVRYFKSDEFINKVKVFTVPTVYNLQPANERFGEEFMDTFLFLLMNGEDIEIYPFNVDPRVVTQAYNAVKFKGSNIREFFHIVGDRFLIVTQDKLRYIHMQIAKPAVTCRALKTDSNTPENYFMLQVTSNTSTCEHHDHSQPVKRKVNEYCELRLDYYMHLKDPEASQQQKALLYGIVILVVACFVGGLLCLMQWRNNKMVILGRLKGEILNFRNRHKRIQPFVEENYEHKEIEIEVPKIEAVLEEGQD
jgi:hypothetical protein